MTCPYCGANLPDNSDFCDACGTPIASWQKKSESNSLDDALFNSTPTYVSYTESRRSSSGGTVKTVAIVAIVALLLLVLYNLLGGPYNGTYELSSVKLSGMELDLSMLEEYMNESVDIQIKIFFNTAKVKIDAPGQSDKGYSKVKINGNTIKISNPETNFTLTGRLDKDEKTISFDIPLDEFAPKEDLALLGLTDTNFSIIFKKK